MQCTVQCSEPVDTLVWLDTTGWLQSSVVRRRWRRRRSSKRSRRRSRRRSSKFKRWSSKLERELGG